MKKILVKVKVIDIPYSPSVEAIPATETEPEVPAIPEQLEVSHYEIIDQTQGPEEELQVWLQGNLSAGKYSPGAIAEYYDLEQDYDYLLSKCHNNRLAEYPSLGDQADASYKARQGDNSQLLAIDTLINAVKEKYPKPIQGEPVAPVIVELFPVPQI
jgi:hypothetical protein